MCVTKSFPLLTSECVLTTPSRSLDHKHCSFKYTQDRHVNRRAWNWKSSCSVVSPKKPLCKVMWLVFECAHPRSYIFMTYENVSGSFETLSCFRNTTWKFVLFWPNRGCENTFCCVTPANMKVCVVFSKSRLWEHILLFNSWSSHCPSCPSSPPFFLSSFTQHFMSEGRVQYKVGVFFFLLVQKFDIR
jgi:hypothetical protein